MEIWPSKGQIMEIWPSKGQYGNPALEGLWFVFYRALWDRKYVGEFALRDWLNGGVIRYVTRLRLSVNEQERSATGLTAYVSDGTQSQGRVCSNHLQNLDIVGEDSNGLL
ncbi:hypothetical protein AVEN_100093-1 [Araneus ventricosus]|uniref:Uncharacterized protein n=1 Tax=Araneus ventricosus TaxID=182803 RepID=A0A4Y2J306_ARAVE|nr:hypothetical protein AVEN_100093-1 [Araneus ventricosus]